MKTYPLVTNRRALFTSTGRIGQPKRGEAYLVGDAALIATSDYPQDYHNVKKILEPANGDARAIVREVKAGLP